MQYPGPFGLKVIELNCFNGSSFYLADVGRIVRTVSRYLEAAISSSEASSSILFSL